MRIWVVTDGRAGNENPALGLAEAVARRLADGAVIEVKRISTHLFYDLAPPAVWGVLGVREGGWPFSLLSDKGASLARSTEAPWPQLVIGAGRRSAPITAAMRSLSDSGGGGLRVVQILSPQMPLRRFDLVVAPQHDRLSGPNVHQTVGSLHRLSPELLNAEDERLQPLPRPLLAVLVGGPSKSARMTDADAGELTSALVQAGRSGWGVAVTASRRTPPDVTARLAEGLDLVGGWLWDGTGANPYYPMLGAADAIVVTADSVNMASEACSTGVPAYIAPVNKLAPKLARFHSALAERGFARPLSDLLKPVDWRPVRLQDTQDAADAVCRLFPDCRKNALK